ncbi:MAG: glutamate--tRNA ligase [Bacteroidales bacterium]|nr:glutamate--tRNA ligase [Bacteroidales bacterium]
MTGSDIRVRFAPSPTGPLHIGGVRTALFNYLFARKHGGKFILRIEDTDQERFVPGAEEYIIESLKWCGIEYDEGPGIDGPLAPYRQSERRELYRQFSGRLIEEGHAYYAFDSADELDVIRKKYESTGKTFQYDATTRTGLKNSLSLSDSETRKSLESGKPYVVRFKMPENTLVEVRDIIRDEMVFNTAQLDDKVLFKADGLPTYHLANVVDDHLMKISHVIRGEEWLPSLALHVLLYKALGWERQMPVFAHLPLILKPGGQGKLSKRDGDKMGFPVFPLQWKDPATGELSAGFRESGYDPEAVVNMLAFLGWNPGTEQEIFTMDELVHAFSLEKVGKSGARFDPGKAVWFNQQYLKKIPDEELAKTLMGELKAKKSEKDFEYVLQVVRLIRDRIAFRHELWAHAHFFFQEPGEYDHQMIGKVWKEDTPQIMEVIRNTIETAEYFTSQELEKMVKSHIENHNLGAGKVMTPLRLLLVGSGKGPHLFDIMEMLGKKETIRRIQKGLNVLK